MDVSEFLFKPQYVCTCVCVCVTWLRPDVIDDIYLCPRFELIAGSSEADSISKEQFLNKLFRPQLAVAQSLVFSLFSL